MANRRKQTANAFLCFRSSNMLCWCDAIWELDNDQEEEEDE
jgi:hypothetical protein